MSSGISSVIEWVDQERERYSYQHLFGDMKFYEKMLVNCSTCGEQIERDVRWEGRKHECGKCKENRLKKWKRDRDQVFRKIVSKAQQNFKDKFELGTVEGKNKYEILDELIESGVV